MTVPQKWKYLEHLEGLPALVSEGLKLYGTVEGGGTSNNPIILAWADEVGKATDRAYDDWAADWYNKDSIAWCGLFMAVCAIRSSGGNEKRWPPKSYLSALAWANFGVPVNWKASLNNVWVGDVGVFVRNGGGHVATIVGISTDGKYVFCLGGNQDNAVNIKMIPVARLYAVRRPQYKIRPLGATHVRLKSTGEITSSEA